MKALEAIKSTINNYRLIEISDRILIAVSGGPDSSALCHMIKALGFGFDIAHVNFQLRSIDSDQDALFVKELSSSYDARFHLEVVDAKFYANEKGLSVQVAARELRYDFFLKLTKEFGYDKVLTAHHASDNLETMLYNFIKGGTISALRGIPIHRSTIVRPLLYTSKSSIDQYISENNLAFRIDHTNTDNKYSRNYIRTEIIPKLLHLNPSLENTVIQTSKMGREYEKIIDDLIESNKVQIVSKSNDSIEFRLQELKKFKSPQIMLYHLLKPYGFAYPVIEDIWQCYHQENPTGKFFENAEFSALINRGSLILEKNQPSEVESLLIHSINSVLLDSKGLVNMSTDQLLDYQNIEIADADSLEFPLILRRWQSGDRFRPLGMQGKSKKVKDFLTNLKINRFDKNKVLVLESNGEIVWIVGYRISNTIAISSNTKNQIYMGTKKL